MTTLGPPGTIARGAPSLAAAADLRMNEGTAEPIVRTTGLSKRYALRRSWRGLFRRALLRREPVQVVDALHDVSLAVRLGECYGLLGPNGAGKTTLFKILATLVLPDRGTALVNGYDVLEDGEAIRHSLASVIPDERSLYWRLSAYENLRLYASLRGLAGAERDARVAEALRAVVLTDTGGQMVGSFSSGMRQRLLLARALLAQPSVLLLDEPTRGLDPVSAREFRRFLREEIIGRRGVTVLLATHAAEEAFELCDRVGVLHRGRLLAEGSANALAQLHADARHELWTRAPEPPLLRRLLADAGGEWIASDAADTPGWMKVRIRMPGGPAATARLVVALTEAGVEVARLEEVRPSLADLLERVVRAGGAAVAPASAVEEASDA